MWLSSLYPLLPRLTQVAITITEADVVVLVIPSPAQTDTGAASRRSAGNPPAPEPRVCGGCAGRDCAGQARSGTLARTSRKCVAPTPATEVG